MTAADQIGMGTIGLLRTGQARYAVVGVDPKEPNHLLAHDIFLRHKGIARRRRELVCASRARCGGHRHGQIQSVDEFSRRL